MANASMNPEQIRDCHERTTWHEVHDVADLVEQLVPVEKNIQDMVVKMRKDGLKPYNAMIQVLGSALDWYKYGN